MHTLHLYKITLPNYSKDLADVKCHTVITYFKVRCRWLLVVMCPRPLSYARICSELQ